MPGGTNGPPVLNGEQYAYPRRTLAQLRTRLVRRLGFAAMTTLSPGIQYLLDDILYSVNEHIYKRYKFLRQRRWWKIDITTGNRFYDIPYTGAYTGENTGIAFVDNDPAADTITLSSGSFVTMGFTDGMKIRVENSNLNDNWFTAATVAANTITAAAGDAIATEAAGSPIVIRGEGFEAMNPGRIMEAWIKEDEAWAEIPQGIAPALFNQTNQARPDFFDVRQYLEFWPEPDQAYEAYFYAELANTPLEYDDDVVSVDEHALFTLSLAKAKFHYGQRDYQDYYQEFNLYIGKLNIENFGARRYVPDPKERPDVPMSKPKATWR